MKKIRKHVVSLPPLIVMAGAASWQPLVWAQQASSGPASDAAVTQAPVEEVVVEGRSLQASEALVQERLEDASVVDTIGAEAISRLGDSTVAASLRRVPGLSLVGDKFVYIRGLGERYSATSLNGADIPSPDLTRNVIPLDIFPTSIVESIRVQKAWSPDLSANFGGGSVNVRTRGIPKSFELNFELTTGTNTENSGKALTYSGGGDDDLGTDDGTRALAPLIVDGLNQYQGNIGVQNILTFLQRAGDGSATLADAQAVNRGLALNLNRNIAVREKSISPDIGVKANVGNRFQFGEAAELGFMVGGTYDNGWRETTRRSINFSFPDERTDTVNESTHAVNLSGTAEVGFKLNDEHEISATGLFLRNTDDDTAIQDFFNENREISDGLGFRNYRLRYEEREMTTWQVRGHHVIGDETRQFGLLHGLLDWVPLDTEINWFYSDSNATTDIPNEVTVTSTTVTDPVTARVLSESVALQSTAADYRFTDLDDDVEDYGWSLTMPLEFGRSKLALTGGTRHSQKVRTYRQSQFSLGPVSVADPGVLTGSLDDVFSDQNIMDTANNFVFSRQGANNQSYIAATMTDAVFGIVDWTYDETWRVATGARWEDYRQVAVDWNPYGNSESDPQVSTDPEVLERGTFAADDIYPSASLTYMSDWLAETFQLRFGWSRTAIRPDLREVTDASYIDPITEIVTRGNSGVIPADVDNYDIRAEWRFAGGDSVSVTLFDKEIDNPIEFFESAASDTTIAREIINAQSAYVRGIEVEGLKQLDFLGPVGEMFFVQGNVSFQESELVAGPLADAPTNPVRDMAGASPYVGNLMLGFDAPAGRHTASLIYNVFGERLYVAGRNGAPDGYEQPFHSLDVTYTWFATEGLTLKLKAQNLLDEAVEIRRAGVTTFEEKPGTTLSLSALYKF